MSLTPSNLRNKVYEAYGEYRTLMILAGWLTAHERVRIDESLENIKLLSRARLKVEYDRIRKNLTELRELLGAHAKHSEYDELLRFQDEGTPPGVLFVPKWLIQKRYFSHYEKATPFFAKLPPHARIGIDVHALLRSVRPETSWRLLEATLFEDMAVLWNSTLDAKADADRMNTKMTMKRFEATARATTRAAFHLLEGYLNGLAFDVLITKARNLNADERIKLSEFDDVKNRPRLLSLREKLLQYPKIAIQADHPPLQESNCPEMKFVLEVEESVRHALVHPTPRLDTPGKSDLREHVFFTLTIDKVSAVIDSVIGLLERISRTLGDMFGSTNEWLYKRGPDGRFPDAAFE